jgi:hypothetical protein
MDPARVTTASRKCFERRCSSNMPDVLNTSFDLPRVDDRHIPSLSDEVRCFVCLRNEALRLPYFLQHHRELGVDRFFIIDNVSEDGSRQLLLDQPDCHVFHCGGSFFQGNVEPPTWTNALLNVFGSGHWCLTVDPDELLVYPSYETVDLHDFCRFLDSAGANLLYAPLIDMYSDQPIAEVRYTAGHSFIETCPYFDPVPGWTKPTEGWCPPAQLYGGVRERVFWRGKHKRTLPPCLSKVPLAKWRRGLKYKIVTHVILEGRIAEVTGALLHFKFLTGFVDVMASSVNRNKGIVEKGLEERAAYLDALRADPDLRLSDSQSTRYLGSRQLVELGFMASSPAYEEFVLKNRNLGKQNDGRPRGAP